MRSGEGSGCHDGQSRICTGEWLAAALETGDIVMLPAQLAEPTSGKRLPSKPIDPLTLRPPIRRKIESLDFSADGRFLAAGCDDGTVQLWRMSLLREKMRLISLDWTDEAIPEGRSVPVFFSR